MAKKGFLSFFLAIVIFAGVTWVIYDITIPVFSCKIVDRTPIQVFGPHGTIRGAAPEILGRKFRYRVEIINLSLNWEEYKKAHGKEEYVHAYRSGAATILTDDPSKVWKFIEGDNRWVRAINWPIKK